MNKYQRQALKVQKHTCGEPGCEAPADHVIRYERSATMLLQKVTAYCCTHHLLQTFKDSNRYCAVHSGADYEWGSQDCPLAHDHCRHGTYVGGCGIDYMCGACESGWDSTL